MRTEDAMHSTHPFSLQPFFFIALALMLSSAAAARDKGALPEQSQTARAQLSGVDVTLEQVSGGKVSTTRTDDNGSFTFRDVAPGSYKLRIGCTGKATTTGDVAGGAGSQKCNAEFRIEITEKSTGVITGSIRKEGR
jgi:hypothetical protein